ncbi:chymotrypsinogen 2-like [Saccostrea cucullata]|uniref:chymotrypsinogen 2-like n=1 Tax=Saccostrea cuccullata TaxID=36930 RepID=UPI002ED4D1CF
MLDWNLWYLGKPQARVDTCTTRGGSCIRSNIRCDGYVDHYALGCRKNVCCKPAPSTVNPEPAHPGTDKCGLITRVQTRHVDPRLRVVGGDQALDGEWPWQYVEGTGDNVVLRHLRIPITSSMTCNSSWDGVITDKQLCIGTGDTGACRGDSGGPLVCLRHDTFVLVGVTSWGSSTCSELGKPNVFTKITAYLPWIQSELSAI